MTGSELAVGDIIAGRFRIIEEISVGSWTSIYRCYQEDLDRLVALKIMHADSVGDAALVERFRREALFASQLTHPNTITTFDYGKTDEGAFYIVMENLNGVALGETIGEAGPLEPERARAIMVQICKSLVEVHRLGMIHRDIKPDNILLCEPQAGQEGLGDVVKVLDFGIAKATRKMDGIDKTLQKLTQAGLVVGTPLYMAPEQLLEEELSFATDIYGLGHILYEMLAGHAPFEGRGRSMQIMMAHIEEAVPDLPGQLALHPLNAVIQRAVSKSQSGRYQDARAMLEALQAIAPRTPFAAPTALPRAADSGMMRRRDLADQAGVSPPSLADSLPSRQRELSWIARHLSLVTFEQQCQLLVLTGEPGIGKSAIVDAIVESVSAREDDFVLSRRHHPRRDIRIGGLWGDVCILLGLDERSEQSVTDHMGSALGRFSGIRQDQIPALLRMLRRDPAMPTALAELKGRRRELLSALARPFVSRAADQTLVWVVEDLQHEDPLTLALLDHICTHRPEARLLIICTLATEDVVHGTGTARMLRPLLSSGAAGTHTLRVGGVPLESADNVLNEVLEGPFAPALIRTIHEPTGGHPRFMVELLTQLHRSGQLHRSAEGWTLTDEARTTALDVQLSALVQQRLLGLAEQSEQGQRIIRLMSAVALLGNHASTSLIVAFLEASGDHALIDHYEEAVEGAIQSGYIERRHDTLRFSAPMARDILRDDVIGTAGLDDEDAEAARESLELAARLMIEHDPELSGGDLQLVVDQLIAAGHHKDAVRVLRHGADLAYRGFNIETALDCYLQAYRISTEWAERQPLGEVLTSEPEQMIVLLRLGEIHGTLGEIALAEDHLEEVRHIATQLAEPRLQATVLARADQLSGELAVQRRDFGRASELLTRARERFESASDDHGVARVIVELANVRLSQGEARRALDPLLEAEVLAEVIGARAVQARARLYMARARLRLGELDRAIADADSALQLYREDDNLLGRADALVTLGEARILFRRFDAATEALGRAAGLKLKVGDRTGLMKVHRLLSIAHAAGGNLEAARGQLQLEVAMAQECQDTVAAAWASLVWADVFAEVALRRQITSPGQGEADLAEIDQHFTELSSMAAQTQRPLIWGRTQCRRALLYVTTGHPEEADAVLQDALEALPDPAHQREVRAMLAFLDGDIDTLEALLGEVGGGEVGDDELVVRLLAGSLRFTLGAADGAWPHLSAGYGRALQAGRLQEAALFNDEIARLSALDAGDAPTTMSLSPLLSTPLPGTREREAEGASQ